MPDGLSLVILIATGLAFWLGTVLIARGRSDPRLRFAGLGLAGYALALISLGLQSAATPETQAWLERIWLSARYLPALFWILTLIVVAGEGDPSRYSFYRRPLPVIGVVLLATFAIQRPQWPGTALLAAAGLLLASLPLFARLRDARGERSAIGLVLLASLFFGLGAALLLLQSGGAPVLGLNPRLYAAGLAFDLLLLGIGISALDAFDMGDAFGAELRRSFGAALLLAFLLCGQVLLVMRLGQEGELGAAAWPMLLLLYGTMLSAILVVTFAEQWTGILDRLVFARRPQVVAERQTLRGVSRALARRAEPAADSQNGAPQLDPAALPTADFERLTRSALSHYGDLSRLAASPLIGLPAIGSRIEARGGRGDTLDRAAELKALLAESIERLRPQGEAGFGVSDEWRHYNVLHFPYVIGIRPFSRRLVDPEGLGEDDQAALDWFRSQVPERSYYRWQQAAAALVAQDLRELHDQEA